MVGEQMVKFFTAMENQIKLLKDSVNSENLEELIGAIQGARSIFVMGAGRSGFVAKSFAMRLMHCGYNVYVVGETVTPRIGKEDVLIAISGSGETTSVVNISKKAKELIGSKLIAITSNPESSLGKLADVVVPIKGKIKTEQDEELSKIAPLGTMFELTVMIYLDALIAELMTVRNLTEKDLENRHAVLE
ncbi:6-phospho-3-hexuloisomerase [Geoglobus acetivorans]|uniref:6-phospho-3-hexuloisomerase n=1 Tax=Geoglobus acetivorans TaxID=565033 RepID=A0A0A7GG26_GEOAI|nr:6-phospho-3-hexuloisomerase [Geoglobus acetivorans]